jgi:3-hydroxymyristoyl/3-hydroxydecanoyl-(acyl carrier protein) dehydratases
LRPLDACLGPMSAVELGEFATGVRMLLDTTEIQKILPHRYPFLMVDAIEEMERVKRIVGIKNVTINERIFRGIFRASRLCREC